MHLSIIAALTIAAQVVPSPWEGTDQTAPLDGRRTVTQSLLSTTRIQRPYGEPVQAVFMLRCAGGGREAMVAWPGAFISTRGARVSWRVDGSETREEDWMNIQGMPTATRTGHPNRLLDAIETGEQLVMRVESYGAVQDLVFDLGDGAAAVAAIREGCP